MSNQVLLKKSSVVAKVPTSGDLSYGEVALNYADGKLYFKNSSNTVQPLGIAYTKVIANTTAKINQGYICNTGAGSFTITLPASPETGHYVIISDDDNFGTNPLYVARNGNPIAGIAENLTIDITGASVTLLWDGGSWNVYSQVGATGGSGSGGTEYNFGSFPQGLIPDYDNTYTLGNSTYKWNYVNSYGYRFGDNTTQTTAANVDGSSITISGGVHTAQAGGLAGSTLNSSVTASSLQTLGTQTQRINWSASGVAAPQFTSSSVGSKLILYPAVGASYADYAIGIDSATIWNGVPANDVNYFFKWYGGTTNIASLTGTGNFTLAGTLAVNSPTISTTSSGTASVFNANATTLNIGGAATTVSIGAGSGTTTVNNNLVVTGTFTVNGTTETINATTITVDDKNIELGSVASPTDVTADGGGITLKGATDKTFNWVDATDAWTSSEHMNLLTGKAYYINATSVLNATTLGSAVVTSSLTTVGTIGTGVWQGTLVAGQYGGTGVNNSGKTITLGGNLTTSGAFATTFTTTSTTSVTLPTSGTLATLAGTETFTNKTLTNPTLTTPTLGVASATSINKVAITAPATGSTLTIADGKTLTASNTLTFTGTDSTSFAFPGTSDTVVTLTATQTLTNKTLTSPTMTTPTLGVASATSVNKVAITAPATSATLTIADGKTLTASNTLTFTGTDASSVAFGAGGTVLYSGGALGTPSSGTLTNATGLPVSGITASTSTALGVGSIELGHATDTTIARSSAGVISVEGVVVPTVSSTNTLTNKTLTAPVIDNIKMGYSTTVTAAGTTTLTVTSNYRQLFTGTTTQTVALPVTSTLVAGMSYEIENNSTGNVTVNSSGGNLVATVLPGTCAHILCIGTTLTTAADWDADFISFSAVTGTGSVVLASSPTLVSPALGTPSSGTLTNCTFPTLNQNTTGSAATLTTPRAINGVNFDGSAAITVTAAAGTLSGATLASGVTASSLTSVGTIATGVWNGTAITGQYGGTGVNNSGKTITLGGNLTTSGAFTTTLTSTANTSVTLPTSGTLAIEGPVFRAYVDTAQTITSSGTQQKVTFGTETFDSNSNFASSRFTPTVAGYYQLNATVRISGGSSTGENMLIIWKNGSEYARGTNQSGTEQGVNFYSMQVSDIAVANGSTDYFEIYIQQTSGASKDITAGSNISYFSGCMVRGA